jgi:hypothetical protein
VVSTPWFEPSTSWLTGHCTTPEWQVVQQWRFRHVFGKRLFRNSSRAPNNWTDVFHSLHQFFHSIRILTQWARTFPSVSFPIWNLKSSYKEHYVVLGCCLTDWQNGWLTDWLSAWLTNSTVHLFLTIYYFLDGQTIPNILWNQTAVHRNRNNPPRVLPCPELDKSSPHYLPPCFCNIHFKIILATVYVPHLKKGIDCSKWVYSSVF